MKLALFSFFSVFLLFRLICLHKNLKTALNRLGPCSPVACHLVVDFQAFGSQQPGRRMFNELGEPFQTKKWDWHWNYLWQLVIVSYCLCKIYLFLFEMLDCFCWFFLKDFLVKHLGLAAATFGKKKSPLSCVIKTFLRLKWTSAQLMQLAESRGTKYCSCLQRLGWTNPS